MNVNDMKGKIQASFVGCVECGLDHHVDLIDGWPDADPSEPGNKIIYNTRDGAFVGICNRGHVNLFFLNEAKANEFIPHMMTELTLGREVSQAYCLHSRTFEFKVPEGQATPGPDGPIRGPVKGRVCAWCMYKMDVHKDEEMGETDADLQVPQE